MAPHARVSGDRTIVANLKKNTDCTRRTLCRRHHEHPAHMTAHGAATRCTKHARTHKDTAMRTNFQLTAPRTCAVHAQTAMTGTGHATNARQTHCEHAHTCTPHAHKSRMTGTELRPTNENTARAQTPHAHKSLRRLHQKCTTSLQHKYKVPWFGCRNDKQTPGVYFSEHCTIFH